MTIREIPTLLWVCTDCIVLHANGDVSEDADREPLGEIPQGADLTMGLLWEEHSDGCEAAVTQDHDIECGCETRDFSWSTCEGCGSHLGGTRHALTMWTAAEEESAAFRGI